MRKDHEGGNVTHDGQQVSDCRYGIPIFVFSGSQDPLGIRLLSRTLITALVVVLEATGGKVVIQ